MGFWIEMEHVGWFTGVKIEGIKGGEGWRDIERKLV
jgi:hypothetical protein